MSDRHDAVGVDIGGSGVRAAAVRDGQIGPIERVSLRSRGLDDVLEAVAAVVPDGRGPVGVGVPGFVRRGLVLSSPNFPEWREVKLEEQLGARLQRRVFILNDANAAAVGAWRSRPEDSVLMVTLGTGVGGGVVVAGELQCGARQTGTEFGHLYAGGNAPCGCGGRGCLETWASTVGMIRAAKERGHVVRDGGHIVAAAADGEAWAKAVLGEANQALGRALVTLANLYAPDVIVLAGGLAQPGLWKTAQRHFAGAVIQCNRCEIAVVGAADRFAIVGAATWAQQRVNR